MSRCLLILALWVPTALAGGGDLEATTARYAEGLRTDIVALEARLTELNARRRGRLYIDDAQNEACQALRRDYILFQTEACRAQELLDRLPENPTRAESESFRVSIGATLAFAKEHVLEIESRASAMNDEFITAASALDAEITSVRTTLRELRDELRVLETDLGSRRGTLPEWPEDTERDILMGFPLRSADETACEDCRIINVAPSVFADRPVQRGACLAIAVPPTFPACREPES